MRRVGRGRELRRRADPALDVTSDTVTAPETLWLGVEAEVGAGLVWDVGQEALAIGLLPLRVGGAEREVERVRSEYRVVVADRVAGMTGAGVVDQIRDHAGAHRVEFDIAVAGGKLR